MDLIRLGINIALPIFSIIKKVVLVFIIFYGVISAFLYFINSDRPTFNLKEQSLKDKAIVYEYINNPELKKTEEGQIKVAMYRGFMCGLFGEGCTEKQEDAPKYANQSLFGRVTGWVASPYSVPPASGLAWAQITFQEAGFVPSAYAAEGIGFSSIKAYMTIWKLFRNISFLLLVVIMLIIGFMIMFRVELDHHHHTVLALQNVLPRIVVTMIFISMSFAIAGFLIDIMYTLIGVSVSLIMGYGMGADKAAVLIAQDDFIGAKFHDLWPIGFGAAAPFGVGSALFDMIPWEFKAIIDFFIIRNLVAFFSHSSIWLWEPLISATSGAGVEGSLLGFGGGGNVGNLLTGILKWGILVIVSGLLTHILPGLILGLVIILTILFLMFKLFFMLLYAYIKVILYVIFAPVILLMGVLPGQESFTWWIRNLIGELIVFPTVIIIMLAGNAILVANSGTGLTRIGNMADGTGTSLSTTIGVAEVPQLQYQKSKDVFILPFLYGFNPADFNIVVALGIILLTPDLVKIVKQWVGAEGMPVNLGLGTFLAGGTMVAQGTFGGVTNLHHMKSALVGQNPQHGLLHSFQGNPVANAIIGKFGGGGGGNGGHSTGH